MTDLKNYLFRVYNKFRIVSLDNVQNLKESVQTLNKYKLNDLIRLLVFGYIDGNGYYSKGSDAELALLSLLSNENDGSISPLAVNLLSNTPDDRAFRVDLGYLMLGKRDKPEYEISFDTFIWILIFYSSKHYIDIKQNLIEAIHRLIQYYKTEGGDVILKRFPKLGKDINKLEKISQEAIKSNHVIKPSVFFDVINSIGTKLFNYVKEHKEEILENNKAKVAPNGDGSGTIGNPLVDILEAMFEIFKAGYYPASISSVLPDTIFATIDIDGESNMSGLADYLLTLAGREYFNSATIDDTIEDRVVRVVLRGAYGTTCILNENYQRWSHIEKRLPGAWKLFRIIYNRLKSGEYDTEKYKFSDYRFPSLLKASNTDSQKDAEEAAQVSWLTLFSSFIMGHVLNLIGRRDAKHLYKVAAPVVRLSDENIFLAPNKLYDLDNVVVSYSLEYEKELRPTFVGKWLKYRPDDYYTSTSNNPTGGVSYNSRYSIIITQQDEEMPKEITLKASESNPDRWQEVVEGKPVVRKGSGIEALELVFYDDDDKPINIAKVTATNNKQGDNSIEPNELYVDKIKETETEEQG